MTRQPLLRARLFWLVPLIGSLVSPTGFSETKIIAPRGLIPFSNAEYYSTSPENSTLMPVNIWGEVRQPGKHFVGEKGNLFSVLSSAGGPMESADLDPILVLRGSEEISVDLLKEGKNFAVLPGDTIVVERSIKADMPLIFGIVSSFVAVGTLIFVTTKD